MDDILEALLAVSLPYNPGGTNTCTDGESCAGPAWVPANEHSGFDGCQIHNPTFQVGCGYHDNVKGCE